MEVNSVLLNLPTSTYESRGTPDKANVLWRFTGSSDSAQDGIWLSTGTSADTDWAKLDTFIDTTPADNSITNAKMADNAIGVAELSPQILKDLGAVAGVTGDILYHNGTVFTRLAKGTDTQILKLVSGFPSWQAEGGGGGSGAELICRLEDSTNASLTASNQEFLEWDVEVYDPDNLADVAGANPSRITVDADGNYSVRCRVTVDPTGSDFRLDLGIHVNNVDSGRHNFVLHDAGYQTLYFDYFLPSLSNGDYLEINTYTNSGGTFDVSGAQTRASFEVWRH